MEINEAHVAQEKLAKLANSTLVSHYSTLKFLDHLATQFGGLPLLWISWLARTMIEPTTPTIRQIQPLILRAIYPLARDFSPQ